MVSFLESSDLHGCVAARATLKDLLKKTCQDIQYGNIAAFLGFGICIMGSLWAFAEVRCFFFFFHFANFCRITQPKIIQYTIFRYLFFHGFVFSLLTGSHLWALVVSLVIAFIVMFSCASVTTACDELSEATKDQLELYAMSV